MTAYEAWEDQQQCNCYVNRLSYDVSYALRRGAHRTSCPIYRESGDPVDRLKDADTRFHLSGFKD